MKKKRKIKTDQNRRKEREVCVKEEKKKPLFSSQLTHVLN